MTNQEMNEKINQIITDFLFPLSEHENSKDELAALSLLLRGFVTCDNDSIEKRPFLLTGINPSFGSHRGEWKFFPGEYDEPFTFRGAISDSKPQDYWGKKRKQFGYDQKRKQFSDDLCKTMAYLDLFPIRESDQRLFEQVFKNPKLTKLRADILSITQDAIEAMAPRLIVHANRQSMYYWGVKPAQEADVDANDYEHPWMGYKVKRVVKDLSKFSSKEHLVEIKKLPDCMTEERLKKFPLYKIIGYIDNSERINYKRKSTSLEGCFLMEYVMEYRKKEDRDKMYNYTEWVEIWEEVKKQSPAD